MYTGHWSNIDRVNIFYEHSNIKNGKKEFGQTFGQTYKRICMYFSLHKKKFQIELRRSVCDIITWGIHNSTLWPFVTVVCYFYVRPLFVTVSFFCLFILFLCVVTEEDTIGLPWFFSLSRGRATGMNISISSGTFRMMLTAHSVAWNQPINYARQK